MVRVLGLIPFGSADWLLGWVSIAPHDNYSGRRQTILDGAIPSPSTRMQTGR